MNVCCFNWLSRTFLSVFFFWLHVRVSPRTASRSVPKTWKHFARHQQPLHSKLNGPWLCASLHFATQGSPSIKRQTGGAAQARHNRGQATSTRSLLPSVRSSMLVHHAKPSTRAWMPRMRPARFFTLAHRLGTALNSNCLVPPPASSPVP